MAIPSKRLPRRGEIWFVKLHVDPPDKGLRPVLIVSVDARNQHERADTVLAIPLTTSVHKEVPTPILFPSAETGLGSDSAARAEDVTVIRKDNLVEPRSRLRQIGSARICQLGQAIQVALGCAP
jgi:mRNA-degrading endonuclease toxin of MazEF toxin-antitoxin module